MRPLVVAPLLFLLAVACGGGDDGHDGEAAATTIEPSTSADQGAGSPRLVCPGAIATFEVMSAPVGEELPAFASAEEAAQAEVDRRDDVESAALIGDDPDGIRYAMLDASGSVVAETVFDHSRSTWSAVRFDSCD